MPVQLLLRFTCAPCGTRIRYYSALLCYCIFKTIAILQQVLLRRSSYLQQAVDRKIGSKRRTRTFETKRDSRCVFLERQGDDHRIGCILKEDFFSLEKTHGTFRYATLSIVTTTLASVQARASRALWINVQQLIPPWSRHHIANATL